MQKIISKKLKGDLVTYGKTLNKQEDFKKIIVIFFIIFF
jgi:hypothetical protein